MLVRNGETSDYNGASDLIGELTKVPCLLEDQVCDDN